MRILRSLLSIILLGCGVPALAQGTMPLATFVESLGINVHVNYKDGAYADSAQVAADLRYLGLIHVRQGVPRWPGGASSLDDYTRLAQQGVRFTMVVPPQDIENAGYLPFLHALVQASPGAIEAIEGFNEINNAPVTYGGQTGPGAAQLALEAVYRAVKADPMLRGIPVYDMTGAPPVATIAGRADVANAHPYPHNARQPCSAVARGFLEGYVQPAPYPRVITEIGNFTLPRDWPPAKPWWHGYTMLGVDETTQAKSILGAYFCGAQAGVQRTYVYELLDEKLDPGNNQPEMRFGVFRFDHSPKPAAYAIRNLVTILNKARLRRGGADLAANGVSGPASVRWLVLRKPAGGLILALWNDVDFWSAQGPVNTAPVPVTLRFTKPVAVQMFDPLVRPSPTVTRSAAMAVDIPVPDHPVLVELWN